jgi:hypothetical protein
MARGQGRWAWVLGCAWPTMGCEGRRYAAGTLVLMQALAAEREGIAARGAVRAWRWRMRHVRPCRSASQES